MELDSVCQFVELQEAKVEQCLPGAKALCGLNGSTVCKLWALQRQVDLQGVFVKVGDLLNSTFIYICL